MNKIVASVGLAALGASSMQAVHAQATAPPPRAWNISATLRGFYDDNINAVPVNKQDSLGFEVSPGFGLNLMSDQTTFTMGYIYTFKYYDTKPQGNSEHYDQIHQFNAELDHRFNEKYQVAIKDGFVVGQEPDLLRANNTFTDFGRVPGNNIRNYGAIIFSAQFTPKFGMEAGYANAYYNYDDHGAVVTNLPPPTVGEHTSNGFIPGASQSGTSDRLEHTIHLDGRWLLAPTTIGVLGYQFGLTTYTGDEPIGILNNGAGPVINSDSRNAMSQYGYAGVDHKFSPKMSGTLRAGARYTDYNNDPTGNNNNVSPYVLANLRYTYAPESSAEVGFTFDRNATDQLSIQGDSFTLDQESAVLYGSITHRILPRLFGSIVGQVQDSWYNGGSYDGKNDWYYLVGLNLQYRFNAYLSAEIGYNYDKLNSGVSSNLGYDRNRVYIGLTARY